MNSNTTKVKITFIFSHKVKQ